MTEPLQTKLSVENGLRSASKIRRLTPEQLEIPSGETDERGEEEKWDSLTESAEEVMGDGSIGVAVRTNDGHISTGVPLDEGTSHSVHALELAIWKAYSESESPLTEAVILTETEDWTPCGRCLQVVADFSFQSTPVLRIITKGKDRMTEFELDTIIEEE